MQLSAQRHRRRARHFLNAQPPHPALVPVNQSPSTWACVPKEPMCSEGSASARLRPRAGGSPLSTLPVPVPAGRIKRPWAGKCTLVTGLFMRWGFLLEAEGPCRHPFSGCICSPCSVFPRQPPLQGQFGELLVCTCKLPILLCPLQAQPHWTFVPQTPVSSHGHLS